MTLRLDRYAPEWARGICEDLEAGTPPAEAVANAAAALRHQADEAGKRAAEAEATAATWQAMVGNWICAADLAREHSEHADEHRQYEAYLRDTADNVSTLNGELIGIAGVLR